MVISPIDGPASARLARIYYARRSLRAFWTIVAVGCSLFEIAGIFVLITNESLVFLGKVCFVVIAILSAGIFQLLAAETYRDHLVLAADRIIAYRMLAGGRVCLQRDEIRGRRLISGWDQPDLMVLVPARDGLRPVKFQVDYFATDATFDDWIASIEDLDAPDRPRD